VNSDEPGFLYYYNQRKTEDVSKALGDLMANPTDNMYLIFNFFGKIHNQRYAQLLETPIEDKFKRYKQFQKYSSEADLIIEIVMVRKQIDDALDERDEDLFQKSVTRLKELEEQQRQFEKPTKV
jgi:uncharacterized protein YpiB (UPF0302 family)